MREKILAALALACCLRAGAAQPIFSTLDIWPYPKSVTLLPTRGVPVIVIGPRPVVTMHGCSKPIAAIAKKILHGNGHVLKEVPRTFPASSYQARDAALCDPNYQCRRDSDCVGLSLCGSELAVARCFAPEAVRWNSTEACNPFASSTQGCCSCAPISREATPRLAEIDIDCSDVAKNKSGAYTLRISPSDDQLSSFRLSIGAADDAGASNALSTFQQLVYYEEGLGALALRTTNLQIEDEPRLQWRGVMLDTSRHFIPVKDVKELLVGMWAAKLNVFHWHIVDSTSFPYESAAHPELSDEGAWSPAAEYSTSDMTEVVQFAANLSIQTVLELDTPAHTMAWGKSHPEIMTDCWQWMETVQKGEDRWDTQAINPTKEEAKRLVAEVLQEVATKVTPTSSFVHIGLVLGLEFV